MWYLQKYKASLKPAPQNESDVANMSRVDDFDEEMEHQCENEQASETARSTAVPDPAVAENHPACKKRSDNGSIRKSTRRNRKTWTGTDIGQLLPRIRICTQNIMLAFWFWSCACVFLDLLCCANYINVCSVIANAISHFMISSTTNAKLWIVNHCLNVFLIVLCCKIINSYCWTIGCLGWWM